MHTDWKVQITNLIADKALIIIPAKYSDFKYVSSKKFAAVLPEQTKINTYVINLEKGKQPPYWFIYSQGLLKLEMFKTYIDINLANNFIHPSKSPADAPILFDKIPNRSF